MQPPAAPGSALLHIKHSQDAVSSFEYQDSASSTHLLLLSTAKKGRDGLREMVMAYLEPAVQEVPCKGCVADARDTQRQGCRCWAGDSPAGHFEVALQPKKGKEAPQVSEAATPLIWAKRTKQGAENRHPPVPARCSAVGQQGCTEWSGARIRVRV